MKNYFFAFLCLPLTCFADPFYGEENQSAEENQTISVETSKDEFAKNSENLTACKLSDNLEKIYLEDPFEKLQFIGVLRNDNTIKALFTNENKQIFDFSENSLIAKDQIQIQKIELKAIHYIQWKQVNNCESPEITIKRL